MDNGRPFVTRLLSDLEAALPGFVQEFPDVGSFTARLALAAAPLLAGLSNEDRHDAVQRLVVMAVELGVPAKTARALFGPP